jgi:site-specific recombinase XerD
MLLADRSMMVIEMKSNSPGDLGVWTISDRSFAQLLRCTQAAFLRVLQQEQRSQEYLRQSRYIIEEYAHFCEDQGDTHPWQLRQKYLASRAALRGMHQFSRSYLDNHRRELIYFLCWYQRQACAQRVCWGELSPERLRAYWRTQRGVLPYRRRILSAHLVSLLRWLQQRPDVARTDDLGALLDEYFEQRHRTMRGDGYGFVLTHRAQIVTRRHLIWLEQHGHLPTGTVTPDSGGLAEDPSKALLQRLVAKVDRQLPEGLRQPLLDYLEYLVYQRGLAEHSFKQILRPNLALCRHLAHAGYQDFARLCATQLDQVVWSLISAPRDKQNQLRRRRQIQARHSMLRGFLRYLYRRNLLGRDLSKVLISPPCYRASKPPAVLSGQQIGSLLASVDRDNAWGRRCYAILVLMTTYGLRPVDVAWLRLDALDWRQGQLALVQKKTGRALTLPLLAEVVAAVSEYLRQDRLVGLLDRRVFVSLNWPHRPLHPFAISTIVAAALRAAGLGWARAGHLRCAVATHLLRQGEAHSTIQQVLGHCTPDTTQHYAVADVELLRRVLEESER